MKELFVKLDAWQDAIGSKTFITGLVIGAVFTLLVLAYSHIRLIRKRNRKDEDYE